MATVRANLAAGRIRELIKDGFDWDEVAKIIDETLVDQRNADAEIAEACHANGDGVIPGGQCCGWRIALEIRE